MAISELKVNISVEAIFQKKLLKTIQKMHDEYGIRIDSVDISWLDTIDSNAIAYEIKTETTVRG